MKSFTTHNGKEIQLVRNGNHIKMQFGSGGELPQDLSGLFTNETAAEIAIIKYLDNTKSRKKEVD